MGESFRSVFGMSPWGPMALAFLFGVAFGWLVWGARRGTEDRHPDDAVLTRDGDEPKEIVVIKAELDAVRSLLDQTDDHGEKVAEQLSALDDAVKRANGRLKTLLAGIKRIAGRAD